MSDNPWTDQIVGERMSVDQSFSTRIEQSQFSNQQWSLIMTATEFEIDNPDDPDRARIVANTDKIDGIIPELDNIQSGMGAMAGGGANGGLSTSSGSLVDSIKAALGMGETSNPSNNDQREAAKRLTQEYANELQSHLESKGRWESVRRSVADDN
ncbi:DUF5799 family protein [Natrinema halophilum]|uniref:Uncharacterized protein n=1 Tax=Natrinema halophilum TaxID=1699371 RepID=A0A7D5GKU7_9EURY|nr:DUF5799 family protein [Natrinema halophilum]QLG48972.1 DUF5799 family protein [Natrinema halophilum]